jgi:hypothetical protein
MKNNLISILLILISNLAFCQNSEIIKTKPEYDIIVNDSIIYQFNGDSSTFIGIDDTEFCIKFPGGDNALIKYIQKNFRLPTDMINQKIEGKIYASFTINEKGKVDNIKIERGLSESIDKAVEKVISEMPDWIWACNEKPRRHILVKRYLPLTIELNKKKSLKCPAANIRNCCTTLFTCQSGIIICFDINIGQ